MNDKLKREFNRLKFGNKKFCVKVCVSDYTNETELLDRVAFALERGIRFIQLEQGEYLDGEFLESVKKISQLISIYEATLVTRGSIAVSYFAEPDGIVLSEGDLSISKVRELLGKERGIGYICNDEESVKLAIKSGADYLIFSTPTVSTNHVVIEYAKWVYENIEIPVFFEVDSQDKYTTLDSSKIDKFAFPINLLNNILNAH